MAISGKKQVVAAGYRKDVAKYKVGRPYKLDAEQFKKLMAVYYYEMEEHSFYVREEDAIAKNGFFFTDFQRKIAESILRAVFMREQTTIGISLTRQIGKTTIVTAVISFCYKHFFLAFGEPFKVVIIAPEKGSASEVFNRVCRYILVDNPEMYVDQASYKETLRGDTVQLFGIHEDSKGSTIEGRTFNLVLRDEAHMGDDEKFSDQVIPTTLRTQGSVVWIGNGALRDCEYRKVLLRGNTEIMDKEGRIMGYNRVFRYTYNTLKPYMQSLADKNIPSAIGWIQGIEKYIQENGGIDSFHVRKNVFCEFILNYSNFLTEETLLRCSKSINIPDSGGLDVVKRDLYLSIDFGHSGDKTVATFLNNKREIEDWFIAKDENEIMTLQEQCERIRDHSDELGFTQRLLAIGGDSTGLGIGAIELLEAEFGTDIVSCTFTSKWKHENYLQMRDLFMTQNDNDRIWFDGTHPESRRFIKEMTEMEISPLKNGYLSFHAPSRAGYYDDMVASLAIAVFLLVNEYNMYNELKTLKSRFRKNNNEQEINKEAVDRANDLRKQFMAGSTKDVSLNSSKKKSGDLAYAPSLAR